MLVNRSSGAGSYQVTATEIAAGCDGGNEGSPCDDDNPCTEDDTCTASACVGTAVANGTPCDDARSCTSVDVCQAGACVGGETPHLDCLTPVAPRASTLVL